MTDTLAFDMTIMTESLVKFVHYHGDGEEHIWYARRITTIPI